MLDALKPVWNETVVIVVSDHDMDTATQQEIDVIENPELREMFDGVIPDGGAALLHLARRGTVEEATAALAKVEGIVQVEPMNEDVVIAGAEAGRRFKSPAAHPGGFHGGPATARSVAIVGGGHAFARQIANSLDGHRPHLADWAPTIAQIFGLAIGSDGSSLLPSSRADG